jgi:hypothetical protein
VATEAKCFFAQSPPVPSSSPAAVPPQKQKGASDPAPPSPASAVFIPSEWNSAIVLDFSKLFEDFKRKQFTLLWRGSRDGFRVRDFHSRCDGHPDTLTAILDTEPTRERNVKSEFRDR